MLAGIDRLANTSSLPPLVSPAAAAVVMLFEVTSDDCDGNCDNSRLILPATSPQPMLAATVKSPKRLDDVDCVCSDVVVASHSATMLRDTCVRKYMNVYNKNSIEVIYS